MVVAMVMVMKGKEENVLTDSDDLREVFSPLNLELPYFYSLILNFPLPPPPNLTLFPSPPTVQGPVDPGRDMETLPADELVSECDTEFELESRLDLDTSQLLDPNSDAGAESDASLFTPQPHRSVPSSWHRVV